MSKIDCLKRILRVLIDGVGEPLEITLEGRLYLNGIKLPERDGEMVLEALIDAVETALSTEGISDEEISKIDPDCWDVGH